MRSAQDQIGANEPFTPEMRSWMSSNMKQESTSQAQISSGAVEATVRLAHQLGIARVHPVILHESQHVSIRLFPADVVARVVVSADAKATSRVTRELRVARHLIENAAPLSVPAPNCLPVHTSSKALFSRCGSSSSTRWRTGTMSNTWRGQVQRRAASTETYRVSR